MPFHLERYSSRIIILSEAKVPEAMSLLHAGASSLAMTIPEKLDSYGTLESSQGLRRYIPQDDNPLNVVV